MTSKILKCLCQTELNFAKITKVGKNEYAKSFHKSSQLKGKEAHDKICKNKHEDNFAAVLYKKNDLRIEKRPVPKITADEVLIRIEVVGLGASDLESFKCSTAIKPLIIGHEASGTVLKCGKNVQKLKPGDKVALEPQIGCKKCYACKTGHYNLCKKMKYCGQSPQDGVLCRYCAYSADSCHKLPCTLDFEHGSLLQPLAVVVHACQRAKLSGGDVVLVSSAGTVGLLGLLVSKLNGASKVIVIDNNEYNLKKAMELGSTYAINVKGMNPMEVKKQIEEITGRLPNKTLDCSCDEKTIQTSICATKSGGQVTLVGLGKKFMSLPVKESIWRQIDISGSHTSCNDYPRSIHMIDSGGLDPKHLVTHHFKLEQALTAFDFACSKSEPFLKVMIHCNPTWTPDC